MAVDLKVKPGCQISVRSDGEMYDISVEQSKGKGNTGDDADGGGCTEGKCDIF